MDEGILNKAKSWTENTYFDADDRLEIEQLIKQNNEKELTERFYRDLEFGTGGLRSIIGIGTNRMNKYNIRRATYALGLVVKEQTTKLEQKAVAISYDSRKFSEEFAQEAAQVLAALGIKVYLYSHLNPVPLLSFAVRELNCLAGIMVTASHNPPQYNGYKVYGDDGAQVIPPMDQQIIDCYNQVEDYESIPLKDFEVAKDEGLIELISAEVETKYYETTKKYCLNSELCQKQGPELKIIYTPLHGTGLVPCERLLNELGFTNFHSVPSQSQPDSSFPTVSSPNPENPEALALAVKMMQEIDGDIVFGSDPDTDRLGMAFEHEGEIQYLTGNQIGLLMLHYTLMQKKQAHELNSSHYFINTIVTSPLQEQIAEKFNVETFKTLTGFKWICGKIREIENQHPDKCFLFATEESFGYLNHPHVRDKDGVSSIALMAEIALHYKNRGMNLIQALDAIYEEYGFAAEELVNIVHEGKTGAEKIQQIMETFRNYNDPQFNELQIQKRIDYLNDTDTGVPKSNVLGFFFEGGHQLFVRPSGTEPKIKFYIMVTESEGSLQDKKERANKKITGFKEVIRKLSQ